MIDFACSACRKKLRVKDESAGKEVKCPGCGVLVAIPALAASRTPQPADGGPAVDRSGVTGALSAATGDATIDAPPQTHGDQPRGGNESLDFLAPPQLPDELGRLGAFRILKVLGKGGMGIVFQAEEIQLRRKVALKTMLPAFAANETAKERFLREARSAAQIEHEHIIAIFHVNEDRGVPFLAMPLLKGQPLDAFLRSEELTVSEAVRIGREIAEGLAAAHAEGMIHRDIKPGNVWLEGDRRKVKILDFGLARASSDTAHLTQSGAIVGTPAYMAPEQARSAPIDARADLFSLGVILYEMLTGQRPFVGSDTMSILTALALDNPPPPREVNSEVGAELSDIVMTLLQKDPERRFASAQEVAERLAGIDQKPTTNPGPAELPMSTAIRAGAAPAPKDVPRRSRNALPVAAAGVLLVAGLGVAGWFLQGRSATIDPGTNEIKPGAQAKQGDQKIVRTALEFAVVPLVADDALTMNRPGSWTIEFWATPEKLQEKLPIVAGVHLEAAIFISNRIWMLGTRFNDGFKEVFGPEVELGCRVHVAGVRDGSEIRLYINGRRVGSCDVGNGPLFVAGLPFWIGKDYHGCIDRVRLSRIARYKDDFQPAESWPADDDASAIYLFNEGHGDRLLDSSPYRRHLHFPAEKAPRWVKIEGTATGPQIDLERKLAQQILDRQGMVHVKLAKGSTVFRNDEKGPAQLPPGAFRVTGITFDAKSPVSEDELIEMCLQAGELGGLALTDSCPLTDAGLARLVAHPPFARNLSHFSVRGTRLTDEGLRHLGKCPNLTSVHFEIHPLITAAGLEHLRGLPLRELGVVGCPVGDKAATAARAMPKLEILALRQARLTDAALDDVAATQGIVTLALSDNPVTDKGLAKLAGMQSLKTVTATTTQVTAQGAKELADALPGCRVFFDGGEAFTAAPAELQSERERKVAEWVLSRGGSVWVEVNGQRFDRLNHDGKGKLPLPPGPLRVIGIELTDHGPVTEKELIDNCLLLSGLEQLELIRGACRLTDAGLERILSQPGVAKSLKSIHVNRGLLTDTGVRHLAKCPNLTGVSLLAMKVTGAGLEALRDAALDRLGLHDCPIDDAGAEHLRLFPQLQNLAVRQSRIGDRGLEAIGTLKNLKYLTLDGNAHSDQQLAKIQGLAKLESLSLDDNPIGDAGLTHLAPLKRLKILKLNSSKVTDTGFEKLDALKALEQLSLADSDVSEKGVRRFVEMHPGCRVVWDGRSFGGKQ